MVAGYKTWATNDVPTSAEVNGYLMSQCVPRFPDVGTRNSMIAAPVLGQMCASDDFDEIYLYNGTTWIGAVPRVAYKPNITTRSSSSLSADPDLHLLLEASSKYIVEFHMQTVCTDSTTDFQMDWSYTGTMASAKYGAIFKPVGATNNNNTLSALDSFSAITGVLQQGVIGNDVSGFWGTAYMSTTTSGTISLRWARVSGANSLDLSFGSFISFLKVA